MNIFILYVLGTFGLVMITNRSSLFKPLREKISVKAITKSDSYLWWFLDSIFGCALCMSVWVAAANYALVFFYIIWPLYILSAAGCVAFLASLTQMIERK